MSNTNCPNLTRALNQAIDIHYILIWYYRLLAVNLHTIAPILGLNEKLHGARDGLALKIAEALNLEVSVVLLIAAGIEGTLFSQLEKDIYKLDNTEFIQTLIIIGLSAIKHSSD